MGRISVGGTLARTAWDGFLEAASEIADAWTFSRFDGLPDVDAPAGPGVAVVATVTRDPTS